MEERTIISPAEVPWAPGAEVTQAAVVIECPVCHSSNPPGDRWCQDCGFLLTSPAPEALEMPAAAGPRLVVEGREFELHAGANTIGRVGADVLLPDPTVSRHHATLTLDESGAWIEDAGSTNGTSLNGSPLASGDRRQIFDGDTVKLGNVSAKLAWPDHAASGMIAPASEAGPGAPAAARAVAILTAADGQEFDLPPGVTTLGRRAENQVALATDAYVSGRHAEIRCEQPRGDLEGGCVLVDVGSTNGTFLRREAEDEEARLRPHDPQPLSPGCQIRLGQSNFTFRLAPAIEDEEEPDSEGATAAEDVEAEAWVSGPADSGERNDREASDAGAEH